MSLSRKDSLAERTADVKMAFVDSMMGEDQAELAEEFEQWYHDVWETAKAAGRAEALREVGEVEECDDEDTHTSTTYLLPDPESTALHETLLRYHGAYNAHQIAVLQNTPDIEATQRYLDLLEDRHNIFSVDNNGVTLYPAFQFHTNGKLDATMGEVIKTFGGNVDGWTLWSWFSFPSGLLSGDVPKDVVHESLYRAQTAARRFRDTLRDTR